MFALDTKDVVGLVTRDDETQAQGAKAAPDTHADEDGGLFASDIMLIGITPVLGAGKITEM